MLPQQGHASLKPNISSPARGKCRGLASRLGFGLVVSIQLLGLVGIGFVGGLGEALAESPTGSLKTEAAFESRQRIAEDLQYLSSDELKGRDTGSAEIEIAAEYIATRFESLGFNVNLFDGGPFQEFTALREVVAGPAEENYLKLAGDAELPQFEMSRNYVPLALGGSGKVTAPLVFAGYGITAPEQGYDDYAGLDVEGKIVAVLRGEPRRGQADSPFGGNGSSRYAFFVTKVNNAIEHGAVGLLIINHAEATKTAMEQAQGRLGRQQNQLKEIAKKLETLPAVAENARQNLENSRKVMQAQLEALEREIELAPEALLTTNQAGQTDGDQQIPVASIGRRSFDALLAAVGGDFTSVAALESKIDETVQPASLEFEGLTAVMEASIRSQEVRAKNVVAEFPGTGSLAGETIVIGAHYDHVGMGGSGSLAPGTIAIHNGADDNGSGTVTMLELAHRLSRIEAENRRRLVFIAFTAEEKGLLGSKHYAREPRFPLEDTAAMINLDMVGRLSDEEGLTVFGTGTAPDFDALVDRWNESAGLKVRKDPSGFGPSDHTSFYEKGIPVLFFFTGLHSDYHRPSDDFHKINLDGMVRITDMVYDAAFHLATVSDRPVYQKTGPGQGVGRVRRGPYLGVQLEDQSDQVVVTDAVSGGPAAAAGIQAGDRILKIGELETMTMSAVQNAVQTYRPGDEIPIVVSREGDEITVQVQLTRRP